MLGDLDELGLTEKSRDLALSIHNDERRKEGLGSLVGLCSSCEVILEGEAWLWVWSDELARHARRSASVNCGKGGLAHDRDYLHKHKLGENLYYGFRSPNPYTAFTTQTQDSRTQRRLPILLLPARKRWS